MSGAWQSYASTLLVFFGLDLIAAWALNLQYGVTGILNFAFVMFESIGAYIASVTSLGPAGPYDFQHYVLGASLPWPIPVVLAAIAGGLLAFILGLFALRPSEHAFQALVMLIASVIALDVVSAEPGLFNGDLGLAGMPKPFSSLGLGPNDYNWLFVGVTAAFCAGVFLVIHRMTGSPYARRLRAIRENARSAATLGIDVRRERMIVFVVGGAIAAISGALRAEFIGAWGPSEWQIDETFILFAAIIVGGVANNAGVFLGVAVVLTGILQSVQYLPTLNVGSLVGSGQWMAVGLLIIAFLWARPQGILPERRRRFPPPDPSGPDPVLTAASPLPAADD